MEQEITTHAPAVIDCHRPGHHIVTDILQADRHTLVLPPSFVQEDLEITPPQHNQQVTIGLLSSGTTGTPKCIWNTLANLMDNARRTIRAFNLQGDEKLYILASPWHVAGLSWALAAEELGAEYRIEAPSIGNTEAWVETVRNFKPDLLLTVPNVLHYMFHYDNWFVPEIVYGGDHLAAEYSRHLPNHCEYYRQAYGQTEAGGLVASGVFSAQEHAGPDLRQCVGTPAPGVRLSCNGTEQKPDSVHIASPCSVYSGFYDSGDLGYFDDQSQLHLTGRVGNTGGNCNMLTSVTTIMHK